MATRGHDRNGSGQFSVGDRRMYVHRVAVEMASGIRIPDGMFACHRCRTPRCCRPSHLYVGTASQNAIDAVRDGTAFGLRCAGEKNPSRKLTEAQAIAIRDRAAAGEKRRALADEFGVSYLTVHYIVTGERWSHLAGATPPRRQHARAT